MKKKRLAINAAVVLAVLLPILGVLYVSVILAGPIATIFYVFLFLVGLFGLPTAVILFAPSFPRFARSIVGKIHFMLGQVAFGHGYLVQKIDKWQMCPGTRERVFVDGEWYDISDGQTNMTILGWKPFGMIRFKTEETLREARVDPASSLNPSTDGGTSIERGGFEEIPPDANISGLDGEWLIDLKRICSKGVRRIGDISLIEKAEEVTMRNEAKAAMTAGWEPIAGSIIGLIIGIATGYVLIGGV